MIVTAIKNVLTGYGSDDEIKLVIKLWDEPIIEGITLRQVLQAVNLAKFQARGKGWLREQG